MSAEFEIETVPVVLDRDELERRFDLPASGDWPIPLADFLRRDEAVRELGKESRIKIVDEALSLFEGFYSHRYFKESYDAVDPIRRLELLRHRLEHGVDARLPRHEFHREMTDIFFGARDQHAKYVWPPPFREHFAYLGFEIEKCTELEKGRRDGRETRSLRERFVVSKTTTIDDRDDCDDRETLTVGAEVLRWNGVPIAEAVRLNGEKTPGSNREARLAYGLALLTLRPLAFLPPPTTEFVWVAYLARDGRFLERRVEWQVLPKRFDDPCRDDGDSGFARFGVPTQMIDAVTRSGVGEGELAGVLGLSAEELAAVASGEVEPGRPVETLLAVARSNPEALRESAALPEPTPGESKSVLRDLGLSRGEAGQIFGLGVTGDDNDDAAATDGPTRALIRLAAARPEAIFEVLDQSQAVGVDLGADEMRELRGDLFAPVAAAGNAEPSAEVDRLFSAEPLDVAELRQELLVRAVPTKQPPEEMLLAAELFPQPHGAGARQLEAARKRACGHLDLLRAAAANGFRFTYLRIYSFHTRQAEALLEAIEQALSGLPREGLIIDVRSSPGGSIQLAEKLLARLSLEPVDAARFQFLASKSTGELARRRFPPWERSIGVSLRTGERHSRALPITDLRHTRHASSGGPALLITDARSYSATDMFAAGFQDNRVGGEGLVLGTDDTTGAGGADVKHHCVLRRSSSVLGHLPGRVGMTIALRRSLRVKNASGTPLEGLGVRPARRHYLTRDDVLGYEGSKGRRTNGDLKLRAIGLLLDRAAVRARVTWDEQAKCLRIEGRVAVRRRIGADLRVERVAVELDGRRADFAATPVDNHDGDLVRAFEGTIEKVDEHPSTVLLTARNALGGFEAKYRLPVSPER